MWDNAHNAYLESRILSASPIELVNLLYQASTDAVRKARQHLAAGEIRARSQSISRACDMVTELASALDHERGGELSRRLAELYGYIMHRLLQANIEQSDAPLAEVLGLLATLAEAWSAIQPREPAPAAGASSGSGWGVPPAEPTHTSQAWSF